ncbi:MAG: sugar phosphate isomerase/epimerase family protein [Pseudomonadota bacterium]
MRLGVNLLCATDHVSPDDYHLFDLAQANGFSHIELPLLSGTPDDYAKAGHRLSAMGLTVGCTAITLPDADPTSGDEAVRQAGIAHLQWIVECAAAMGAETVGGPFHAAIGQFTGAGPTEDELARGAEAHHQMAEEARTHGMVLALEALNRFETHFLNTAAQARAYAQRVDHPNFGLMYDTFHAHIDEKSQPAAVAHLGDKITVLHASENDRGVPGTGQIDFAGIFAAARSAGFNGPVVMEAFGSGLPALAAATRVWRPLFPDLETLFKEGGAALKQAMDTAG